MMLQRVIMYHQQSSMWHKKDFDRMRCETHMISWHYRGLVSVHQFISAINLMLLRNPCHWMMMSFICFDQERKPFINLFLILYLFFTSQYMDKLIISHSRVLCDEYSKNCATYVYVYVHVYRCVCVSVFVLYMYKCVAISETSLKTTLSIFCLRIRAASWLPGHFLYVWWHK